MLIGGLPADVAFAIAAAGVDVSLPEDELERAILEAVADRRGYVAPPIATDGYWTVELLSPIRETYSGRTRALALAWTLVAVLVETRELGIDAFRTSPET